MMKTLYCMWYNVFQIILHPMYAAKMQQILSESLNKYIGINLPPEGKEPLSHGIDSRLLQKLFSDIYSLLNGVHSNLRNGV